MLRIKLDLKNIQRSVRKLPEETGKAAKQSLGDIKDEWVRKSVDIAPLDSANLRRQIHGQVEGNGLDSQIIVTANAVESTNNGTFNYGYYIHEGHMAEDGKKLRHEGTVEKFLEEPVDEEKWKRELEQEIERRIRGMGW